jgi:hypothetical protein
MNQMRERYSKARHEARVNRRNGVCWMKNPVRLVDGWPGVFVSADGSLRYFAGFNTDNMFPRYHEGE